MILRGLMALALIVFCLSLVGHVAALSQQDIDAINGDWVNWVPDNGTGACGGGVTNLSGSDNAQKAFNYFVSQGLPPFQAAGILGNMQAESGVLPERLQSTPPSQITPAESLSDYQLHHSGIGAIGWGIVQWTPPGKMVDPTKAAGKDPNDIAVQLDFLWASLTTGNEKSAGDALRATTNVDDAAETFLRKFERADIKDHPETVPLRKSFAEQMLKQYGNGAPSGSGSSSSGCTTGNVGDISAYKNPFHDMTNVVPSRIDEGVDYVAKPGTSVPVYAIGKGVVKIATDNSTFYRTKAGNNADWITYQLTDGPAAGDYVYVAEGCNNIGVSVGEQVYPTTRLCDMQPDSIETGWASGGSNQSPAAYGVYKEGFETAYGVNFNQLLVKLGAPAGHLDTSYDPGGEVLGILPAGWPSW